MRAKMLAGLVGSIAAVGALAPVAEAEVVVAIDDDAAPELIAFDTSAPGTLVARPGTTSATAITVTGLGAGETIVGIDYRPANGRLYAVTEDGANNGRLYTINEATGVAQPVGGASFAMADATHYGVDFNPVVDRLRIVSTAATGNNLRVQPDTGALVATDTNLSFPASGDANSSETPQAVAAAYTDNVPGASTTTLFDLHQSIVLGTNGQDLVRQGGVNGSPSPNGGVLTTIGSGFVGNSEPEIAFDISAAGTAFALASNGGQSFYLPADLATGQAGTGISTLPMADVFPHASAVPAGLFSVDDVTVDEGAGTFTATVRRTAGSVGSVAVGLSASDGSATGADYALGATTLTFANGQTVRTVTGTITGDADDEATESFTLSLANATNGAVITDGTGTATIRDDDPTPSPLAVNDVVVSEGGTATFTVSRTSGDREAVTVDYATSTGTAGSGDFSSRSGTLTVPAGANSASFTVPTTEDTADEVDETFRVTLSNATGAASIADGSGTGTIIDDDAPPAAQGGTAPAVRLGPVEGLDDPNRPVTLTATASGGTDAVRSVRFTANGRTLCTDTSSPYTCEARLTDAEIGDVQFAAIATDAEGRSSVSSFERFVPRFKARFVSLRVEREGEPGLPATVRVTGAVLRPGGVDAEAGCENATVTVRYKVRRRLVTSQKVDVADDCTFETGETFGDRRILGRRTRSLRVLARFNGSRALRPRNSRVRSVRIR